MKIAELRLKPAEELKNMLADYQKEAARFRFSALRKKAKNVKELRELKKQIARVHTILREKHV